MSLFDRILAARGMTPEQRAVFLSPDYTHRHDPFLLPDMAEAVERLVTARVAQERITIYGDYDIDGLTATTLLLDAFASFGFEHVEAFIPNRFVEGYGLTVDAIERIAADGAQLIVTVDCGSLSHKEIDRAKELGVDVIVTDHHNVAEVQPTAIAVVNPKRLLADYPERYEDFMLQRSPDEAAGASVVTRPDAHAASLSAAELAEAQTSSPRQDAALASAGDSEASAVSSADLTKKICIHLWICRELAWHLSWCRRCRRGSRACRRAKRSGCLIWWRSVRSVTSSRCVTRIGCMCFGG